MRRHEDFEELAALAAIGQLSVEEHGELLEHQRGCAACRRTSDQFNFILDELPLPEPSASDRDIQQLQGASYRQRFLERASAVAVMTVASAIVLPKVLSRLAARHVAASTSEVVAPARTATPASSDSNARNSD